MNRRRFLQSIAAGAALSVLGAKQKSSGTTSAPSTAPTTVPGDLAWNDVSKWPIEGRAFADTELPFDRLPARAKGVVRPEVWSLSRHSAGMSFRFESDAPEIYVRYVLLNENLAMPHMPASGVSGLDLYGEIDNRWQYIATHQPRTASPSIRLASNLLASKRKYLINLPLYNGVKSMGIAVTSGSTMTPVPARTSKPILFYGTSITQGGCASRPGMAFTNILSRRLDRTILNFGFSGNGRLETEVVRFLAEIDAALFVLDCNANTTPEQIAERTEPCITLVREKHPELPILLLESRTFASAPHFANLQLEYERKHAAMKSIYDRLHEKDKHLHYRTGDDLIGEDDEGTVDGSHPTDLGMMRYADALEPTIRTIVS
ncbi:MAG TPA: SGNH/GDSL hydrolase family protein [Tepidisphaeraceae bacterium]|jgi:lysophospholipase L1-like esterase